MPQAPRELALLCHCCKVCYVPYAPEDIDHCTEHAGTLQLGVSMGRDYKRQAMVWIAEKGMGKGGSASPIHACGVQARPSRAFEQGAEVSLGGPLRLLRRPPAA